jgi:hypothetical protein
MRAHPAWIAALLLGVSLSCRESPPPPKLDERHVITIEGSRVSYNGHELRWDVDVDEWQKVLGARSRRRNHIYIWDELGITVSVDHDTTPEDLQIQFGRKPHSPHTTEEPAHWPQRTFTGRLTVDGALIHSKSIVPEVNRDKKQSPFVPDYIPTKFRYYTADKFRAALAYGYDFTLTSFTISKPLEQEKPPDWEKRLQIYNERCRREQCDADPAKELEGKPTDWDRVNRQVEEAKKVKRPW